MKIDRLIPMTDFVLNFSKTNHDSDEFENTITDYAEFIKQPLKLEMFVPCDEDGNVLRYPISKGGSFVNEELCIYEKAKEKVLFEGFYQEFNATKTPTGGYLNMNLFNHNVEFLVGIQHIILTELALKQIYK